MGVEPILVHKASFILQAQGSVLEFILTKGQVMKIQLTEDMIGQIRLLLQTISDRANWGLGETTTQQPPTVSIQEAPPAEIQHKDVPGKLLH